VTPGSSSRTCAVPYGPAVLVTRWVTTARRPVRRVEDAGHRQPAVVTSRLQRRVVGDAEGTRRARTGSARGREIVDELTRAGPGAHGARPGVVIPRRVHSGTRAAGQRLVRREPHEPVCLGDGMCGAEPGALAYVPARPWPSRPSAGIRSHRRGVERQPVIGARQLACRRPSRDLAADNRGEPVRHGLEPDKAARRAVRWPTAARDEHLDRSVGGDLLGVHDRVPSPPARRGSCWRAARAVGHIDHAKMITHSGHSAISTGSNR